MSNAVLIIGESGTGKSSSIKNLNAAETFIINVLDKPLPFQGFKNKYIKSTNGATQGNYWASDDHNMIIKLINVINQNRSDIKNLIIDDFQYTMSNEFMRRAKEKGYEKFTEIGLHGWSIIRSLTSCRDDLNCFILSHSDTDSNGRVKCKTIGKMIDEKISLEGMFTIVLHSMVVDSQYKFLTQNDGSFLAKSPVGLFGEKYIDNDLLEVVLSINSYFSENQQEVL